MQAFISGYTDVDRVTVTLTSDGLISFQDWLKTRDFSFKVIELVGVFHSAILKADAEKLKQFCRRHGDMQLPSVESLLVPVRSNSTGEVITKGVLHEIAIDEILVKPCEWYTTVKGAVKQIIGFEAPRVLSLGPGERLPPSFLKSPHLSFIQANTAHGKHSISGLSNEAAEHPYKFPNDSIAIIGMASRFSGAECCEDLWEMLLSGDAKPTSIPSTRYDQARLHRKSNRDDPFRAHFMDDVRGFDHNFFRISPRQAKSMDPQQRMLLELAYETLLSSSYFDPEVTARRDSRIGCFIGVGSTDYENNVASHSPSAFSATGVLRAFIPGNMSHFFGWTGPAITIGKFGNQSVLSRF